MMRMACFMRAKVQLYVEITKNISILSAGKGFF